MVVRFRFKSYYLRGHAFFCCLFFTLLIDSFLEQVSFEVGMQTDSL